MIGGTPGTQGPLRHERRRCTSTIARLSALRAANPALADGAQIHRYASRRRRHLRRSAGSTARTRHRVPRRGQQRDDAPSRRRFATYSGRTGFTPALRRPSDRCAPTGTAGSTSPSPPLSVSVWKATLADGHGAARAGGLPRPRRRPAVSSAAAPRSAPRSPTNTFAQVTFAYRPVGHDGLAAARHGRQRAVPRVPGRQRGSPRAPCWSTARWPRTAAATSRRRSSYGIVGDPAAERRRRAGAGRSGHPAGRASACRGPQLRDGLRRRLAARLRPGAADAGRPGPDLEGHLLTLPAGTVRLQGRDRQELGRELRRRRRAKAAATSRYTAPGGNGDVLLRPRDALRHQ